MHVHVCVCACAHAIVCVCACMVGWVHGGWVCMCLKTVSLSLIGEPLATTVMLTDEVLVKNLAYMMYSVFQTGWFPKSYVKLIGVPSTLNRAE